MNATDHRTFVLVVDHGNTHKTQTLFTGTLSQAERHFYSEESDGYTESILLIFDQGGDVLLSACIVGIGIWERTDVGFRL